MKWLKRGRQIGLAVKNAGRLREILGVFARHGFTDVAHRMKLERWLPSKWQTLLQEQKEIPSEVRLRMAFEELGPTFVKFGQLLASRPDLIPESFVDEFSKLQDDVKALPFEVIRSAVESEFGKPIAELYQSFEEKPLGAASIAQVHGAVLPTGERVVVKVQRPGIDRIVDQDIALLDFLARMLEKYVPESQIFAPVVVVDEFFRVLHQEIDFAIEANNIAKMTENYKVFPDIKIPRVYRSHSNTKVLTLERLAGIPLKDMEAVKRSGVDLKKINELGARAFFKSVMMDGLFHGDLHGGNIFLLPDGKLGLIDFGMVGRLSDRSRGHFSNMVLAMITEDFETLCYCYAELGSADPSVDFDAFQREVRNTLAPYLGMKANDVNSGRVLIEATKIAARYQIRVPGDWMMVFRAMFTVEGLGRALDPEFDVMELGRELVKDLVKDQFSIEKSSKELLWIAKDLVGLLQVAPRHLRWALKKWSKDGYSFELKSPQLSEMTAQLEKNARKTSLSVMSAGLFIASAISMHAADKHMVGDYPAFTVITFLFACFLWWRS